MSHEVLMTRRQSIFYFFANPGRGGPQKAGAVWCWLPGMLRPASAWICKKIRNAFSSDYQDLMGHLILTTSPWSILIWITLLYMANNNLLQMTQFGNLLVLIQIGKPKIFTLDSITEGRLFTCPSIKGIIFALTTFRTHGIFNIKRKWQDWISDLKIVGG